MTPSQVEATITLFRALLKSIATADEVADLQSKVDELEQRITELEEPTDTHLN